MLPPCYRNADGLTGLSVKLCSYLDILLRGLSYSMLSWKQQIKRLSIEKLNEPRMKEKKKGKGEVEKMNESIN